MRFSTVATAAQEVAPTESDAVGVLDARNVEEEVGRFAESVEKRPAGLEVENLEARGGVVARRSEAPRRRDPSSGVAARRPGAPSSLRGAAPVRRAGAE